MEERGSVSSGGHLRVSGKHGGRGHSDMPSKVGGNFALGRADQAAHGVGGWVGGWLAGGGGQACFGFGDGGRRALQFPNHRRLLFQMLSPPSAVSLAPLPAPTTYPTPLQEAFPFQRPGWRRGWGVEALGKHGFSLV